MKPVIDVTLLEPHANRIRQMLATGNGNEAAAYLKLGVARIQADPWTGVERIRLVSHAPRAIQDAEKCSSSPLHVTWKTQGYMRLLSECMAESLVPAIVHTHALGKAYFSEQDDKNEAELARTASIKGTSGLASIVLGVDGSIKARLWLSEAKPVNATTVQTIGGRFFRWSIEDGQARELAHLERQARLFGQNFNSVLMGLRVAVVGCGGTGSPVALLLARLGVGHLLLVDNDTIEATNLNRVHGSHRADATEKKLKVDVIEREINATDLGVQIAKRKGWVGDPSMRDAIRSCDFIFGCTDDHSGRLMLNRLAYFYGIPVIDVGLRMVPSVDSRHDINGRVTTLAPGRPCLLCGGIINPVRAAEEALERCNPLEYQERKKEAYVVGAGDPAPAVVTLTTEMGCVAVNEMIAALTGFHGEDGMIPVRVRRFHARDDRFLEIKPKESCRICASEQIWGRGDMNPFLDVVGM